MIRTKRKSCVTEKGKKDFSFDYKKELSIYYFVNGEKMSRRQWRMVNVDERYNRHEEWETYIKNKYKDFLVNDLREFVSYLEHRGGRIRSGSDFSGLYISAILATLVSFLFPEVLKKCSENFSVYNAASALIQIILMVIFITFCAKKLMDFLIELGIDDRFCKSYIKVLNSMIAEKERQGKQETDFRHLMQTLNDISDDIAQMQETAKETKIELQSVKKTCMNMNERVELYCVVKKEKGYKNLLQQILKNL